MRPQQSYIRSFYTVLLLCGGLLYAVSAHARPATDTASNNNVLRAASRILNPDTAIVLYDSAYKLSQAANYPDGAFVALITKGIKYFEKQDYESYRTVTYEAIPWAKRCSQPDAVAWCLVNIGESWFSEGDYIQANEFYYKALIELNSRTKEITHTTSNIYNSLGLVNMRLNQNDKAINYFDLAEATARQANLPYQLAIAADHKGEYYLALNKPDSAAKYFNLEMQIGKNIGKVDLQAFAYAQLGKTYVSTGNYEKGIGALQQAMSLARNRFNPPVVDAAYSLGDALRLTGKYKEAEAILLWAYSETRLHNYKDYYITCYAKLAALYKAKGQHPLALAYMDTLLLLKDSLTSIGKAHTINHLEIKYKTSEKDRQLAESRLLIEKQQGKLTRKNILIASVSGGVCLLAILLSVMYRNTRNKQKLQEEQMKSMEQVNTIKVLNAMVEGEEKERIRIARELHDGIGGMLSAAMMRFSTLPRQAPAISTEPVYTNAMTLLGEIGDEIRKTAHNLMPEVLMKQTLPDAINALCNNVQVEGSLKTDSQCYGDFSNITQDLKLNIYRIVQELLKNVIKHAQATTVLVQVMKHDHSLTITVEDNGAGFDTNTINSGMGLHNIKARVDNLGGHCTLESAARGGTTIFIEFELENNPPPNPS